MNKRRAATAFRHRYLLCESLLVCLAVHAGLKLLGFGRLRQALGSGRTRDGRRDRIAWSAGRIVWSVTAVSSRIPRSTCLTRALAAEWMLARHGHAAELVIGVAKDSEGFKAHAWVEAYGRVLVGRIDRLDDYSVLGTKVLAVESFR